MAHFLIVPQWQGSPAARAMLLIDGANAIAGDLPSAATTTVDIPVEAGDALGTDVHRLSSLLRIREALVESWTAGDIVVGGDCGVAVSALSALPDTDDLAVLWCDAHGDLHTPETSPSKAFAGMALRAVLGEGEHQLALTPGIPPERVVTVGVRALDDAESVPHGVTQLTADDLQNDDAIARAIRDTGAQRVWIHIDLDVLDPSEISGVLSAQPFGVGVAALSAAITTLRTDVTLAGASLTGFAPRSPDDVVADIGGILRLIGALA